MNSSGSEGFDTCSLGDVLVQWQPSVNRTATLSLKYEIQKNLNRTVSLTFDGAGCTEGQFIIRYEGEYTGLIIYLDIIILTNSS